MPMRRRRNISSRSPASAAASERGDADLVRRMGDRVGRGDVRDARRRERRERAGGEDGVHDDGLDPRHAGRPQAHAPPATSVAPVLAMSSTSTARSTPRREGRQRELHLRVPVPALPADENGSPALAATLRTQGSDSSSGPTSRAARRALAQPLRERRRDGQRLGAARDHLRELLHAMQVRLDGEDPIEGAARAARPTRAARSARPA